MNLIRLFRRVRACTLAFALLAGSCVFPVSTQAQSAGDWQQLFNGKDFAGWEIVTYPWKQEDNYNVEDFGFGKDPLKVFSVNDQGEMYITGQVYGGISTLETYSDYHLRMQVKWGEKKWPPRANSIRDSGILYHCRKPHQAFWEVWMGCLEYQVQEGDFGDLFTLVLPIVDTLKEAEKNRYQGDGTPSKNRGGLRASLEPDAPHGEWNMCDVITRGNDAVHIANGYVVHRFWNARSKRKGPHDPKPEMDSGYIQLQSEGAEVTYRDIKLRPLDDKALAGEVPAFEAQMSTGHIHGTGPENGVTVTYTHQGDAPVEIIAIELYGADARSFLAEKPAYPITLEPNGSTSFKVYLRKDAKGDAASVKARIETLAGPSTENVEIAAHK